MAAMSHSRGTELRAVEKEQFYCEDFGNLRLARGSAHWLSASEQIRERIAAELGDAQLAQRLAEIIEVDALCWRPPAIAPNKIQTIIGFTFGNRMAPNGNREPGPVNQALAALAARLSQEADARLIAQWEVAEAAASLLPPEAVISIFPRRDERDEPVYLGTTAVLEDIARRWPPESLGCIGVIAFSDHAFRCVETARRLGFDAYVPAGYALPTEYDPQSGQAWCRNRLAYLLHDVMLRVSDRRAAILSG